MASSPVFSQLLTLPVSTALNEVAAGLALYGRAFAGAPLAMCLDPFPSNAERLEQVLDSEVLTEYLRAEFEGLESLESATQGAAQRVKAYIRASVQLGGCPRILDDGEDELVAMATARRVLVPWMLTELCGVHIPFSAARQEEGALRSVSDYGELVRNSICVVVPHRRRLLGQGEETSRWKVRGFKLYSIAILQRAWAQRLRRMGREETQREGVGSSNHQVSSEGGEEEVERHTRRGVCAASVRAHVYLEDVRSSVRQTHLVTPVKRRRRVGCKEKGREARDDVRIKRGRLCDSMLRGGDPVALAQPLDFLISTEERERYYEKMEGVVPRNKIRAGTVDIRCGEHPKTVESVCDAQMEMFLPGVSRSGVQAKAASGAPPPARDTGHAVLPMWATVLPVEAFEGEDQQLLLQDAAWCVYCVHQGVRVDAFGVFGNEADDRGEDRSVPAGVAEEDAGDVYPVAAAYGLTQEEAEKARWLRVERVGNNVFHPSATSPRARKRQSQFRCHRPMPYAQWGQIYGDCVRSYIRTGNVPRKFDLTGDDALLRGYGAFRAALMACIVHLNDKDVAHFARNCQSVRGDLVDGE